VDKLVEEIIKPILEANGIKKVIGVYGGRFQPFGPHHLKTYKWLQSKVDEAYITTSNIKKPPRHPMNFKEKVRHMTKMGVKANRIVEEKTPLIAANLLKKFDKKTTAVVYIFGQKDAGRLKGGKTKSGKLSYFQDYKKNKGNIKGHGEHGYFLVAPHVSMNVGGKEVSGTTMRELLGSDKYDDKERAKLFKKMFGYFNQGIYNMMTNKFKKLFEQDIMHTTWDNTKEKPKNPKLFDKKKKDLLKGWIEEGVPTKLKKVLGKYVPNNIIANNAKLIAFISKNPMLINQLLRLATEEKINENITPSQLSQVEKYLDKLWGKVGIDVEFTKHFMDRVKDKRNEKPITSAEVLRIFKQTYKKYGKQIPKLGDDAEALMKDMKTDVNVPFALHWNGKELEMRAKTIMRKKDFKSSNKKFAVEKVITDKDGYRKYKKPKNSDFDEPYKHRYSENISSLMRGYPTKEQLKKYLSKLKKIRGGLDSNEKYQYEPVKEDVKLPIKVGDTILMGRFKNKKVVIKDIDFNDNGDLTINGRPALKFRIMKEFFETIPNILKEGTNTSGVGNDDGPSSYYGNFRSYRKRGNRQAERLGYKVIDYIMKAETKKDKTYRDYPNGPVKAVSFLPSGIGTGGTPNNQENLTGAKGYNKWKTHIQNVAKTVGMELINFLDKDEEISVKKDSVQTIKKQKEDEKNLRELFTQEWWKENLITEGGAYGHMAHPFDDKELTFGDLKKIIELGLGGQLNREDNVTEKLDGQNIMVSFKDGKLIAARNKGHIKNGGKTALDKKGIASKFKGRGAIRNAFVYAMNDLEKAIKSLSDKQQNKIFNNGYNFMNLEVMYPSSANVIDYDVTQLIFHGALKYDDNAKVIGEVPGSARMLQGMIKQRNQNIQKKYSIGKPVFLDVPKHQDFGKMKGKFLGRLQKLQNKYGLKDNDTLGLYHQKWWEAFILKKKKDVSSKVLEGLVRRWAFFEKKYSVAMMKKDIEDEKFLEFVLKYDKENHSKQVKENMRPFEILFFEVGAEILKNVKGFISANPKKSVRNMVKNLDKAIKTVQSGGDVKKLSRLKTQLDRLEAIGGTKAIVPSEGLVFKYKGKTYKFTGAFAPINQITGLVYF